MIPGIHGYRHCKALVFPKRRFWAVYAQDKISRAWKSDVTSIHTAYHFFSNEEKET